VDLKDKADLIVVGSARGGTQAGNVVNFAVHVTRVVKGDPTAAGANLPVSWNLSSYMAGSMANASFTAAGNGLWFLRNAVGGWQLLPVSNGDLVDFKDTFFPQPSGPILSVYAYSPTASLAEAVASEVCFALESMGNAQRFSWYSVSLDQLNSPITQRLYNRLSASGDMSRKILGLSGLIREGNIQALATAAQLAPSLGNYQLELGVLSDAIRNNFRSTDPSAIQSLGAITTASTDVDPYLRQGAAFALRAIHTQNALPYLAALLDDPDANLRAAGIGGLSCFANGLPIQTPANVVNMAYLQYPASAPFQTADTKANFGMGVEISKNEAAYLSFWKNWWAQNRTALGY